MQACLSDEVRERTVCVCVARNVCVDLVGFFLLISRCCVHVLYLFLFAVCDMCCCHPCFLCCCNQTLPLPIPIIDTHTHSPTHPPTHTHTPSLLSHPQRHHPTPFLSQQLVHASPHTFRLTLSVLMIVSCVTPSASDSRLLRDFIARVQGTAPASQKYPRPCPRQSLLHHRARLHHRGSLRGLLHSSITVTQKQHTHTHINNTHIHTHT